MAGCTNISIAIRTGGSAQTPCIVQMLSQLLGPDKVVVSDIFNGVSAGLAVCAWMDKHQA